MRSSTSRGLALHRSRRPHRSRSPRRPPRRSPPPTPLLCLRIPRGRRPQRRPTPTPTWPRVRFLRWQLRPLIDRHHLRPHLPRSGITPPHGDLMLIRRSPHCLRRTDALQNLGPTIGIREIGVEEGLARWTPVRSPRPGRGDGGDRCGPLPDSRRYRWSSRLKPLASPSQSIGKQVIARSIHGTNDSSRRRDTWRRRYLRTKDDKSVVGTTHDDEAGSLPRSLSTSFVRRGIYS